ncbi:MAG TPA: type II secretion system protein GspC [Syntrophobacteria bacterium]|jgi:general secretion pathway protein C|nr:type II secretion system protein GspC [Syntrophobacteria bacterium]
MKHRWLYNILVLTVIVYFSVNSVVSVLEVKLIPPPAANAPPVKASVTKTKALRRVEQYAIVSERNLFGGAGKEQEGGPADAVNLDEIPLALKNLGLKLVGTVFTGVPAESLAFIEDLSARKQETYREGDRVKQVLVKKILRQSVIINTGKRDEMLTMEEPEEGSGKPAAPGPTARYQPSRPPAPPPATSSSTTLPREEVESSLSDLNQLMQQARIRPYLEANKPAGFLVSDIKPGSIFAKMGLRNGDVVQKINDQNISSPEQAIELYQGLMEGGGIALEIKRGQKSEKINYEVQ